MAGIYVHIPFCKSRCIYCGFYSTTRTALRQQYVDALCQELEMRKGDALVETIYLGGGTPSQLSIQKLQQVFDTIYKYNKVSAEAEVTIECNPDDVTEAFAGGLSLLPVNRVSMGAQTFSDERLRFLKRRHTSEQVGAAVDRLRKAGIGNLSIDLMYGFPDETLEDWEADILQACALQVEHISSYCLMIEEGTPLARLGLEPCDEETERTMYDTLIDRLEAAGYEHYEISNFAKSGYRSRHNSSYWTGIPYIGIGAAAHSFDGNSRSWNIDDIQQYIDGLQQGQRLFEEELLDEDTHYNDTVTVALRTREGLNLTRLSETHRQYCLENAKCFIDDGLLRIDGDRLHLTRRGLFVSDMIMSELMMVD
jgi:oxygen-independent coproporphyrinogen-3 oxidase